MVTVLDGPTLTDATASNEENSKIKFQERAIQVYQVENKFSSSC
jgi:hypothetical protein